MNFLTKHSYIMRAFSYLLIVLLATAFSYSVPFAIEAHQKNHVTTSHSNTDRGGGRGTIISIPPPK